MQNVSNDIDYCTTDDVDNDNDIDDKVNKSVLEALWQWEGKLMERNNDSDVDEKSALETWSGRKETKASKLPDFTRKMLSRFYA